MNNRAIKTLEFDKIIKKLMGVTSSSLGREQVEALLPETDFDIIHERLKETTDGVNFILKLGFPPLGSIHDIRKSLKRAELGAVLNPGELLKISDILRTSRNIKDFIKDVRNSDSNNSVFYLIESLELNKRIEEKIKQSILNEEELCDNASPTLASIRRQIKLHQNSIKDRLNDIIKSSKYQKFMQESIVTMRSDRYVIPVKQEHRSEFAGIVHDASSSGATLFMEPMAVVEANNGIKQLKMKEETEIERILLELTQDVVSIIDNLNADIMILGKLDFIFAKAKFSLDYKCTCPKLNKERRIVLKRARHPLIDARIVVPIDFWIGDEFQTLVITGPNTGGKTVTLKTVGLFTLMAQSGLHLPANDGTEICVFDKVFADIGDEQSIEQSLSTFSSHMKNIVNILEDVDCMSLVLFDELGAGTDPTEGAALAMSILENLHALGAITVATTHYSELKLYAISKDGVENASCEFDVETLRPTYRLLIGVAGKSNAFAISKRLGLSDNIIEKARELLTTEDLKFEDMLITIEKNLSGAKSENQIAETMRRDIERLKEELLNEKNNLLESKKKILQEAREESRKILLDTKAEADDIVASLKQLEKENDAKNKNQAIHEARQKLNDKIGIVQESMMDAIMPRVLNFLPPENLKVGDTVLISSLGQKGSILTLPGTNGEALVQVGIMKINMHISNLKIVKEQKVEVVSSKHTKIGIQKSINISSELDLRGSNLDDAIEITDKYIDDAVISGLHEVMIIHGKGTGVLRAGLHKFFRTHPHVNAFRLGRYGEGEMGVTVLELK